MPNFWGYVSHSDKRKQEKIESLREQFDSMKRAGQIISYMELDDRNGIIFEVILPKNMGED